MATPQTLNLCFEPAPHGPTILRIKQQQPPWRVVRGFQSPSGETLAHIHNMSGGILDTDTLAWQIEIAPHARAQVTSTGATRIYRSRSLDRVATQHVTARVAEGGYLEYLPDAVIPFAGSRFEQTARVELSPGASLIWWDLIAPGREASGELFRYHSLSSTFHLIAAGEPVALERWILEPHLRSLDSPARLDRFRHFATCYVCRAGEPAAYWRTFESELQTVASRLSGPELLWGVTSLRTHGLVLRGAAVNGRLLAGALLELWSAAKWFLCGRVAIFPRKVR